MSTTPTSTATGATCWSCQAATSGDPCCAACGKIQPLPRGTDSFAFFGLPPKLRLDEAEIEKRFHQLSWKLHPDNFVRAGEYERELSLERSSQLNNAYRMLRDPIRRVEYLLARAGVRKEGEQKQQAPPELLEEVFELNEWLDVLRLTREGGKMSATAGGEPAEMGELRRKLEAAQNSFEEKWSEVDTELDGVFSQWDTAIDARVDQATRTKLMARMNEVLNRRSYIRNLVRNVAEELGREA